MQLHHETLMPRLVLVPPPLLPPPPKTFPVRGHVVLVLLSSLVSWCEISGSWMSHFSSFLHQLTRDCFEQEMQDVITGVAQIPFFVRGNYRFLLSYYPVDRFFRLSTKQITIPCGLLKNSIQDS
jgi:hypothetical protein